MKLADYLYEQVWPRVERFILRKGYNPEQYWMRRGRFFVLERYQRGIYWQHAWLLQVLQKLSWNSLLEIGCGFGRNLKFLAGHVPPSKTLRGMDFSSTMLQQARRFLRDETVVLQEGSILTPPPGLAGADVVLTHGTLMHIRPADIERAVEEIVQLAGRFVICIEQGTTGRGSPPISQAINAFTFDHPYDALFNRRKLKIVEEEVHHDLRALLLEKF